MIEFDTDLRDLELPACEAATLERVIVARAGMLSSAGVADDVFISAMARRAITQATGRRFAVMVYRYEDPAGPVCVVAALTDATADRRPG